MLTAIRRLLSREPRCGVAVFGKSSAVNGHQGLAGDATTALLGFARRLYYEGMLPNCAGWEERVRAEDPVLASRVVRWSEGRITFARLVAVAEGGSKTKALAPMVVCAEVDGLVGLERMQDLDAAISVIVEPLAAAHPRDWARLVEPLHRTISQWHRGGAAGEGAEADAQAVELARALLGRLGGTAMDWAESLAEELDLAMTEVPRPRRREQPAALGSSGRLSRAAPAPRTEAGLIVDIQAWTAFLHLAGAADRERWLYGGEPFAAVRVVVGAPQVADFEHLWMPKAAAAMTPEPLSSDSRERVRHRTATWSARVVHGASGAP